ncbi:sugar ABC transporter substrate-binding protein [Ornithinimicrobium pekingense]|uniref:Sugar ABC transporter substrate-binding protein n=1 Tax=Ornithinimicrobium pekingense TaxID=384677 RepID=A0ABQ2F4L6_9MICO|nr:sugar ABC transporter substrate-binding protein [Ornithinimicrobium pekingense]GGK60468.1 sugar ABC transporter substrate-binding protein [Ornithinimicrobium pekingense]
MSRTTRSTRLLALVAGASLVLTACGGDATEDGGDGAEGTAGGQGGGDALTVWIMEGTNPDATPFFEEVSTAFEEQTGATLDVQFVPWASAHDQFTNAIAGGTGPDVAEVGTTWTPEFGDAGALMDLSDQIGEAGLAEQYLPSLMEAGTLDESVYGAPWYAGVRSLVYNTEMLEAAGVEAPTTWDELVEVGTALKEADPDVIPFPVPASVHTTTPFIWGAGGEVAVQEGDTWTSGLDSAESREGLDYLVSLVDEHGLSTPAASTWNEADTRDAFAQEDAAMIISGSWTPKSIIEANADLEGKLGVVPIPGQDGGMAPSFAGGSHLSVFETTDQPDLAWQFVEMMTSGEFAQKWGEQTGFFPGTNDLLSELEEADDPLVAPFATQMKDASKTLPVTPMWGQVEGAQVLPAMMGTLLSGDATVEEATQTAADEMNEIFGS